MKIKKAFLSKSLKITYITIFGLVIFLISMGSFNTTIFSDDSPKKTFEVYLGEQYLGRIYDTAVVEKFYKDEENKVRENNPGINIYQPANLNYIENNSFDDLDVNEEDVINKLKDNLDFLTNGYVVTINDFTIINGVKQPLVTEMYVENKEVFLNSLDEVVRSFIDENQYNELNSGIQLTPITTYGTQLVDVYVANKIEVAEALVPLTKLMKTNEEIKQYLLYSANEPVDHYTVKVGDSIESVAAMFKLNPKELLAVNTNLKSLNQLLNPGDVLAVQLLNPIIKVVGIERQNQKQVVPFEVITTEDRSLAKGVEIVEQEGVVGEMMNTYKVLTINGFLESATVELLESKVIVQTVPRKVTVGTLATYSSGSGSYVPGFSLPPTQGWLWPTSGIITSGFGPRWGDFHPALDIADNSMPPVFAPHSGVVTCAGACAYVPGNSVIIDTGDGFVIKLFHFDSVGVRAGESVNAGTYVGKMGSTGISTGIHLHFQVEYNGVPFDPSTLY